MTEPLDNSPSSAPLAMILLPVAVALHIAEEWFGGFIDWASREMDVYIDAEQFVAVNTIGLILFVVGSASAYREPSAAWIGVSLAALAGVNAIAHTVLSLYVGEYSPGTITGLLLYIPISFIIIRWAAAHLSRGVVVAAIMFGIGVHVVATLSATS